MACGIGILFKKKTPDMFVSNIKILICDIVATLSYWCIC